MFKIAKGYRSVSKTIRIPEKTAELLERLATKNYLSFNQLINQCIQFALSHMNEENSGMQEFKNTNLT
ncbi:MAG: hypothetical protein K2K06_00865 [Oscillospiraceae bacterium]|nr:hypothetical protein [Ruminococcus sp.]MDE6706580.1 hypothetical protein [Oscillospiraceae bacterium]